MPSIDRYAENFDKAPIWTSFKFWLVIVILFGGAFGVIKVITAPARSAAGIIERTLDPDAVIANYEWFKNQKGGYDAALVKLDSAKKALATFNTSAGDRKAWTFEDKQEHARLTTIVSGLEGQIASYAADYNARSKMMNRALFKDGFIVVTDKDPMPETLSLTPTDVEKR